MKIKQQSDEQAKLSIHLQYLPRGGQFVPKQSYYILVQLYYSLCNTL